ncbi:MAG: rhomboid family intramembrane serine protease [Verrucomicrobia bacterium]|nr:MAG: rhomboid family intramembrane serine protease [Verrucomicrobiota bacterium]
MIYDRPYMRSDNNRRDLSPLGWILAITIGAFVVQNIMEVWFNKGPFVTRYFALSLPGMQSGYVWTLLTYSLLHGSPLHILVNLLGLYFIGREIQPILGPRRFVWFYLGAILLGGASFMLVAASVGIPAPVVGCSAAVFAVLTVFALFFPEKPITFLLFFLIPVTVKPRYLLLAAVAISAFGLLFMEIPGRVAVAHSSHLGGMLAGWIYVRFFHQRTAQFGTNTMSIELPAWLKKKKKTATRPASYTVNITSPADLKAEVDRILDKINSKGFGALTDEERRILDSARDILNKR